MFRKLVASVPFSPALAGQLGFYARRLKQEEVSRRLGLVFTALALVVQSLTVFTPPESANAANFSDFIRGGIDNKRQLLAAYDRSARGNGDLKDIMDYAGVTRAELANLTEGSINSKGKGTGDNAWKTWGRSHRFSAAQGEVKHVVPLDGGGSSVVYSKPLWLYDSKAYTIRHGSTYPALVGHSKKLGQFAIMKDCGNLVTTKTPQPSPKGSFLAANCTVIRGLAYDGRNRDRDVRVFLYFGGPPGKGERSKAITADLAGNKFRYEVPNKYRKADRPTKVWASLVPLAGWSDSTVQFQNTATIPGGCIETPPAEEPKEPEQPTPPEPTEPVVSLTPVTVQSKTARNLSQQAAADEVVARASDRIEYTIHVENVGQVATTVSLKEELADVLEYARISHNGGGEFDQASKVLGWNEVQLAPNERQERSFVVQVMSDIPSTPQGLSEPGSYDCVMTNSFGNTISTKVDCQAPKAVESTIKELPKTGPTANLIFAAGLAAIVTYFWARSRQLGREVRLIRNDINAGVI